MIEQTTRLRDLVTKPELLIPPKIKEFVAPDQLIACSFQIELGRMNQEYFPDLAVLVALHEGDGFRDTEDLNDNWSLALRYQQQLAIEQGVLNKKSVVLISFIASEHCREGIFIETMILHPKIRGVGIGKDLLKNFENLAIVQNYKYMCADNSYGDPLISEKLGWQPTDRLEPETLTYIPRSSYIRIRFLDRI